MAQASAAVPGGASPRNEQEPKLLDLAILPLSLAIPVFAGATLFIVLSGVKMAHVADRLADRSGLGEALIGAVLVGGTTSLPGSVVSVNAAWNGYASLAVSNGFGGIAAQTTFLGIADMAYRKANLEHAAAAAENLTQGALLVTLLGIVLVTTTAPPLAVFGVNPASLLLILAYLFGVRLIATARAAPMWHPARTLETREDEPAPGTENDASVPALLARFALLAAVLAVAGYAVAKSAVAITQHSNLSETIVGSLFTAVATSMPELVIAVSAVRRGALTLAVGDILGGNSFDVLFVALSDAAYRGGSIYHALSRDDRFVMAVTILLTGILLLGLLRREKHGMGNIGFESVLMLVTYVGAISLFAIGS